MNEFFVLLFFLEHSFFYAIKRRSVNNVPRGLKDVQKRGIKLKIQLDPPGKSRVSRTCPVDTNQNDDTTTCSFTFEGQEKNEGSVLNSVVR